MYKYQNLKTALDMMFDDSYKANEVIPRAVEERVSKLWNLGLIDIDVNQNISITEAGRVALA